jgi:hypothetical protein
MVSIGHVVPSKSKIEIEILIFPIEKTEKKQPKKGSILSLQGILGNVEYEPEMKKRAWESAVEEKFLSD